MKRYFFYKPDQEHKQNKSKGYNFNLRALYGYNALRGYNEERSFSFFDIVDIYTNTNKGPGFSFKIETGTELASGHWAKNSKELETDMINTGYILISESNYLRLRKVAMNIIQDTISNFNYKIDGDKKYTWQCISDNFYDVQLIAGRYKNNIRDKNEKDLAFAKEMGWPVQDHEIIENFKIHTRKKGDCTSLKIESNFPYLTYKSFEDAFERAFYRKQYELITEAQHRRVRNLLLAIVYKYSVLEYEKLKKRQDYTVRILS